MITGPVERRIKLTRPIRTNVFRATFSDELCERRSLQQHPLALPATFDGVRIKRTEFEISIAACQTRRLGKRAG
ncbi:hypothetical protein RSSM_04755 [Rhodopirellula sallentina SM41]|uniref:Uncharacterized protein n=1 Tax=Rhodopirellula sallentina SM41 TaxID=1263870 RepID=M5UCT6_9BACT|nr:hypothetical protein RSSM_04755 [Rhodopirellula sallentina SM41]